MAEFKLVVVPGVIVDRWGRMWAERMPGVPLRLVTAEQADGAELLAEHDAGLLRLPVDTERFHAIPLYTETTVVIVPKDHMVAAADEVTLSDLADETLLQPADDVMPPIALRVAADRPPSTAAAVEWVAAGVGVLIVPQSLARANQRKDLVHRPVTDAPTSSVGLVWPKDRHTDLVEEMIGVVRGRTANSTRGRGAEPPPASGNRPGHSARQPGSKGGPAGKGGQGNNGRPAKKGR